MAATYGAAAKTSAPSQEMTCCAGCVRRGRNRMKGKVGVVQPFRRKCATRLGAVAAQRVYEEPNRPAEALLVRIAGLKMSHFQCSFGVTSDLRYRIGILGRAIRARKCYGSTNEIRWEPLPALFSPDFSCINFGSAINYFQVVSRFGNYSLAAPRGVQKKPVGDPGREEFALSKLPAERRGAGKAMVSRLPPDPARSQPCPDIKPRPPGNNRDRSVLVVDGTPGPAQRRERIRQFWIGPYWGSPCGVNLGHDSAARRPALFAPARGILCAPAGKGPRQIRPQTKIAILTRHNHVELFRRARRQRLNGFILKQDSYEELNYAIRTVLRGGFYTPPSMSSELLVQSEAVDPIDSLTPREKSELVLHAQGYTMKDIANELHISVKTAETHRNNLGRKLACWTRSLAASFCV